MIQYSTSHRRSRSIWMGVPVIKETVVVVVVGGKIFEDNNV